MQRRCYKLTSNTPTRITPTPAHCPTDNRSRKITQASNTVTALNNEVSAVTIDVYALPRPVLNATKAIVSHSPAPMTKRQVAREQDTDAEQPA
jgi:hypothetical protein